MSSIPPESPESPELKHVGNRGDGNLRLHRAGRAGAR